MRSLRSHAGFFEIDHSNSPGLRPEDVAHIPGAVAVGEGEKFERDIKQCTHCQRTVVLEPLRTRDRGYCPKCDHYICDGCETIRVKTGACVPALKLLDLAQEHAEKFIGREDNPDASRIIITDQ